MPSPHIRLSLTLLLAATFAGAATAPAPDSADALVDQLLRTPPVAQGPGVRTRVELLHTLKTKGDAAVPPLQKALDNAKTDEERSQVMIALDALQSPAVARMVLKLATDPNDTIRYRAISKSTDFLGIPPEQGGLPEVLPTLAKLLPEEKNATSRQSVCALAVRVNRPIPPAKEPDARLVKMAIDMLQERLKNDDNAQVRLWAAISLADLGDNSGLAELKKATLAMQSGNAPEYDRTGMGYPLERLVPALERTTGQTFGPVPMNPMLSSTTAAMPNLEESRKALLEKVADWIRSNPSTSRP